MAVIIGAVLGGASAAINHQPIWQGMLMGALGGALVGGGAALAAEMGFGAGWGAAVGGIIGGISNSAVNGGNLWVGALTGGLGAGLGFGLGSWAAGWSDFGFWGQLGGAAIAGAVAGGVGAELSGGKFGQGAWMGAAYGSAGFLASYGANSFDPKVVKSREYARQARQSHNLSVKRTDMVKVPVGNRSVSFFKPAKHQFLPDWEVGPGDDGKIYTTNTVENLSDWKTHIETQNAINSKTAGYSTTEVSASGLAEAKALYESTWGGDAYAGGGYNSNYAVNTVIYAAGGNVPGAFWAPEFSSPTLYYSPDPNN